jgi:hypothetical protein
LSEYEAIPAVWAGYHSDLTGVHEPMSSAPYSSL